jgi:hypothetical protein
MPNDNPDLRVAELLLDLFDHRRVGNADARWTPDAVLIALREAYELGKAEGTALASGVRQVVPLKRR